MRDSTLCTMHAWLYAVVTSVLLVLAMHNPNGYGTTFGLFAVVVMASSTLGHFQVAGWLRRNSR